MRHRRRLTTAYAFTLAELLIALAILGVIATFAIPKVLQAQKNSQRSTVFKESIATLSSVLYTGWSKGDISSNGANIVNYMLTHINAVKICNSNSIAQSCHTGPVINGEGNQPGFVMHNGAVVMGISSGPGLDGWVIDWNGSNGPNVEGDDQLHVVATFANSPRNGTIFVPSYLALESQQLWQSIFQ